MVEVGIHLGLRVGVDDVREQSFRHFYCDPES
jgi:hypothetical protein